MRITSQQLENMSRSQRIFYAAQEAAKDMAYRKALGLLDELQDQPCISVLAMVSQQVEWYSSLNVAINLLMDSMYPWEANDDRFHTASDIKQSSAVDISKAERMLAECIEELNKAGEPYALASHILGQNRAQFQWGFQDWDDALINLADRLAEDVAGIVWELRYHYPIPSSNQRNRSVQLGT